MEPQGTPERPVESGFTASGRADASSVTTGAGTSSAYAASVPPQSSHQQASAPAQPATASSQQAAVQPKKHTGRIIALSIVALLALTVFLMGSCVNTLIGAAREGAEHAQPNSVAVITMSGTIGYNGTSCSPEGLKELLDEAQADPNIKAVVLRVNSGGGTATAGEEMASYVRDFKASKPIVVSSAAINCSAAYEISSQADRIFVAKSTEIGSIGTVMQSIDYSGLMKLLGVNIDNIASAESKDSSYGSRPLTDEERAYYQDLVDQINAVFTDNVAQGRHLSAEEVSQLATGLPFTGVTAVNNGLADEIGTLEDALDAAASLAGLDSYSKTTLELPTSPLSSLLGSVSGSSQANRGLSASDLEQLIKELNTYDGNVK